jgi:hypothetical protein
MEYLEEVENESRFEGRDIWPLAVSGRVQGHWMWIGGSPPKRPRWFRTEDKGKNNQPLPTSYLNDARAYGPRGTRLSRGSPPAIVDDITRRWAVDRAEQEEVLAAVGASRHEVTKWLGGAMLDIGRPSTAKHYVREVDAYEYKVCEFVAEMLFLPVNPALAGEHRIDVGLSMQRY